MVNISEYIKAERIIPDLRASDKIDAITKMVNVLYQDAEGRGFTVGREECVQALCAREKEQSTGIGDGVAFPHAKIPGWEGFSLVLGFCREGVDFNSPDKKPAHLIILLVSSDKQPYIILQAMSAFIRFIKDKGGMQAFLPQMLESENVASEFLEKGLKSPEVIRAKDIMRPVIGKASLTLPIEKATRLMYVNHLDALPVVDDEDLFVGEISCHEIFQFGIPDFFKQLTTVSFVRHIDPFEKYFRIQKQLKVEDITIKDIQPIDGEATLMEMIFALTVKNFTKLYIVNSQKKLIGVIDRHTIIDKILFL